MKALFVAHSCELSGANRSFLSNIIALNNRMDITVLVNKKSGPLQDELIAHGVNYIYIPYSWWYAHARNKWYKRIIRYGIDFLKYYVCRIVSYCYLKRIDLSIYDVVYTNTSTVDIGARIALKNKIPHIWHIREFGNADFGFLPVVSRYSQKKIFKKSARIILISKALEYQYSFIESEKRIVIYNGFNISKLISKQDHKLNINLVNVLITGQVSESKGQVQGIRAVANLREKGINIELTLAGNVDQDYLKAACKKLGDTKKWLHVLGPVSDMKALRESMDLELVCSRSEAFGRVTIEAMLHNIPVIGAHTGGTPELISDCKTGMLFEYGNVNQLEEKVLLLIKTPSLYNKIQLKARVYASQFTLEHTVSQILKQIYSVVNRKF